MFYFILRWLGLHDRREAAERARLTALYVRDTEQPVFGRRP